MNLARVLITFSLCAVAAFGSGCGSQDATSTDGVTPTGQSEPEQVTVAPTKGQVKSSEQPVVTSPPISQPALTTTPDHHLGQLHRPRVIVTTDGEADDRCSMVRFLLTANEFDVEAIVNSSSQFHWQGGTGWHAFHPVSWVKDQFERYAEVYDNLPLHDSNYPSPDDLLSRWKVGNIDGVGEDSIRTEGAEFIASVLLDESDPRPVWVQAWGGCNTISRALKIVQEDHPTRMKEVADELRLFLIWEQDESYQKSSPESFPTSSTAWPTSGRRFYLVKQRSISSRSG
jgi:hypothetical protein